MSKGGRRGLYHEWVAEDGLLRIESWARDGLTDAQIANNIGVATGTLYEWKKRYPEIDESIKKGKRPVDLEVENKLFRSAVGYEYEETKTIIDIMPDGSKKQRVEKMKKYAQPDTSAQIFWLKNRRPDRWRQMSPEFRRKTEAETAKLEAEAKLSQKELERIQEEMRAEDGKILFVDSTEEMRKWLDDNDSE